MGVVRGKLNKMAGRGTFGVALAGIGLGLFGVYKTCFYTVEPGHRAVIFSRYSGVTSKVKEEGLHFKVPWLIYPIMYNIRAKPKKIVSPTGSKDLQIVNIGLRVLYKPDPFELTAIYRTLGVDFDERVLPSITNEVLKAVVAQFNASQLITQRAKVSLLVREQLIDRARDFHILLDDVSITDLSFSSEYTAAVESKQVAQQDAQRAQFLVERAMQERQEKIVRAEGEAKAAMLLGQALKKNPGYLKLRKIRAAQAIAQTISQSQNRVFLNADTLMLNLKDMEVDFSMK